MIDDRFSALAFEQAGLDTPAARKLADLLEAEIQNDLDPVLERAMDDIVARLNAMGHNLTKELATKSGAITYYDYEPDSTEWHKNTRLRLGLISTVAAGYRDMVDESVD
jgi:tRNA U34 5-carboxymethylaminomethyl modifying GTPase MnmE/TrmE